MSVHVRAADLPVGPNSTHYCQTTLNCAKPWSWAQPFVAAPAFRGIPAPEMVVERLGCLISADASMVLQARSQSLLGNVLELRVFKQTPAYLFGGGAL